MAIPSNLTLIREDDQRPRSLSDIRASMQAVPTEYVMVVGTNDVVDVISPLISDVHYLTTHVTTRRAYRHTRPFLAYDPVMLAQCNFMGIPIIRKDLAHLFPSTAREPWHQLLVQAQLQGATISPSTGEHRIVEPWPRPERSGAFAQFRFSLDPDAVMAAVPTVLVREINQQPFFTLRNPTAEAVTAFCHNCSDDFIASLAGLNVTVETLSAFDYTRIRAAGTNCVAWFSGMAEPVNNKLLSQLQVGLEFPTVTVVSPRTVNEFDIASYCQPAFSLLGIRQGFNPNAWLTRTRDLGIDPPSGGYINAQAIVREIT